MMRYTYALFDVPWVQRRCRWHAILVCDELLGGEDSFMSHLNSAHVRGGLSELELMAIRFPGSSVFGDEERVAMELATATIGGKVSDGLFEEGREMFGDQGMVEFAIALAYWVYFCHFENALRIDPGSRPHTRAMWSSGWVADSLGYGDQVRLEAVRLVDSGMPISEVAHTVGVPVRALESWIALRR
jgi:hypothetical protein